MDDEAKDDVISPEDVAEADKAEAEGCPDMLEAAKENKEGAVRHFIRSDVNSVHKTHEEGYTPLHLAAGNGHVGVVQRLLEAKAAMDAERNKCGSTPLHFAAFNGHIGVVQRLLEAEAAVDAQDKHGSTPLHFAAWDAHVSVVERLLEAKAAMDVKDADGKTPYNLAKSRGHKKVMGLLHPDGQTSQAKENLKEVVQRSLDALGHRSLARENLEVELKDAVLKYAIDSTKVKVLLEAGAQQKAADAHLEEKLRETLADLVATNPMLEERQNFTCKAQVEVKDAKVKASYSPSRCRLVFRLKEMPAVVKDTGNIDFPGRIVDEAKECFLSFPGKYASGWDALIDEKAEHKQSIACVFLCTPESGLGQHSQDPEEAEGVCYCHKIYGDRDHKQLGYLKLLRKGTDEVQEEEEKRKAQSTKTVVIREDASEEELKKAEQEAKEAWEKNRKRASWGCAWFEKWKENVIKAVELGQQLKVVFFPGQVGQGKVAWKDLPKENLWNGIGCGGSQKSEIAYLDMQGLDYVETDAINFLCHEFQWGTEVIAMLNGKWQKGMIVSPPQPDMKCSVLCSKTGRIFETDRVRHGNTIQKLLEAVSEYRFMQMVENKLPEGVELVGSGPQESILQDGEVAVAVEIEIGTVNSMQKLRNDVLNEHYELELNEKLLRSKHGRCQLRLDKTHFCEDYESQLLQQSKLTEHQRLTYEKMQKAKSSFLHLSAVAGAGKTFLAVQMVIETLKNSAGQILFVAPNLPLCFYFMRWLGRRGMHEKIFLESLLDRVVVLTPDTNFMKLAIQGGRLVGSPSSTLSKSKFDLTVVDEAHDIFKPDVLESGFLSKVDTKRWLVLSNLSQSSVLKPSFPADMTEVRLTEVVRCTKRIVAGAAAFHATPDDKEGLGSLCPDGPPLKTFLFEAATADAVKDYGKYVEHTISAIQFIVHSYTSLSLHHRLALLISDDDFRKEFQPELEKALRIGFQNRRFGFTTFEDSMSVLPLDLLAEGLEHKDQEEVIILDTVEHAKGLEQLFVICIDLDSRISDSEIDVATRARIYQGLTRAQLHAVVVNEVVKGGWLEFLGLIESKVDKFDESTALEETRATAASEITSKVRLKEKQEQQEEQQKTREARATRRRATTGATTKLEKQQIAEAEQNATKMKATKQAAKIMVSSIWDTGANDFKTAIHNLRFDPRVDQEERERQQLEASLMHLLPADIKVGVRCQVARKFMGTVKFVGVTKFAAGLWVGVELDAEEGKNDGSVAGERYFETKSGHGIFVKPENVRSETSVMEEMEEERLKAEWRRQEREAAQAYQRGEKTFAYYNST